MTHYLLSVYQPDGPAPPDVDLTQIRKDLDALNDEVKAAGAWVFGGGLHAPTTATVLRSSSGEVVITDGPYTEGKEHLGGFTVISAPDLDAALEWARRFAHIIAPLPIEVRPFADVR